MTLKDRILKDLTGIKNPGLLNQIYEFIQSLKESSSASRDSNKDDVLKFDDTISDEDAKEITASINVEFNKIEGDWS